MIRDTFDFAADAVVGALGEEVLYNGVPARGVFSSQFREVVGGEVRVSSRRPELSVRLAAFPCTPAEGDTVRIRDVDYLVTTVRHDHEDVTATLILKRA